MDPIDNATNHLDDCASIGTDEDCDCNARHPEQGTPRWCDLCSPDVCTCPGESDAHPDLTEYDCDRYRSSIKGQPS